MPGRNIYSPSSKTSTTSGTITKSSGFVAVRVKDIILDEYHPEYEKYGKSQAIGVIKYEAIGTADKQSETKALPEAYPLNPAVKSYPLINEIVILESAPQSAPISRESNKVTYYSTIVNAWNLVNHNASPSHYEQQLNLGKDINSLNINPVKPAPGDTLLQGRHGQSIRFTGYKHINNLFVDSSNNGEALTIIRNGQKTEQDREKFINEDVNKDDSSIYLTSNHTIPVEPVTSKQDAFTKPPTTVDSYKGRQIIIDSGRLVFNTKDDDILLSAKDNIGLTGNIVGIDGKEYIGLDATKIYLGKNARKFELQPVILGNSLELFLSTLLSALDSLSTQLTAANANGIPVLTLNTEGPVLKAIVASLKNQINPNGNSQLKSRKVYTE